jgi:HK97 family phage portal protein
MNLIQTVRSALGMEQRSTPSAMTGLSLRDPSVAGWFGGEPTSSGVEVTEQSALRNLTVMAILKVLSNSVASLPLILYERTDKGRTEAFGNPLHDLLCVSPNPETSAYTFWESFTLALALGNAYAEIQRDSNGVVIGLWNLHPWLTRPWRAPDGSLKYVTTDGEQPGQQRILDKSNVLHCPLLSFTGDLGWSPVKMAAESIGVSIAATQYSGRFFGSGSRPGGIMSSPSVMKPEQIAQTRQDWQTLQGGVNQGKTAFLMGDWKYQPISLTPEESQFLETQQFNRQQLAALWQVPPHMIGDMTKLSDNNYIQQSLQFNCDVIRPYTARICQQITMKILGPQSKYHVEFDLRERLKGDPQSTYTAYSIGRNAGFLSVADIREAEGLDPIGPEGKIYLVPVNYTNLATLLNPKDDPATEDLPTEQVRNTLGNFRSAYLHTMRDAVSRMCARDVSKRDAAAVTKTFEHILLSLSEIAADEVRSTTGQSEWKPDATKAIRDHLRTITERAATWTTETIDTTTAAELVRAVKAMSFAAHHSAADHSAKKATA